MIKIKIFIRLLFLFVILPVFAFSQIDRRSGMDDDFDEESPPVKEKEIDPLIKLWYLEEMGAFKDSTKLDTTINNFHIFNPVYKNAVSASYLGNYGTPHQNNNFFNRESQTDFFFFRSREAYILNPEEIVYYNTHTPYTMLDYSQSEHKTRKNETRFNVLHTRNINPYLNFTFRFDQAKSAGQYKNQESKNNSLTLYSSYNKDKLSIHGGFISNRIENNENGGLTNDDLIFNTDDTDFLDVNLNDVRNELGNTYFFATGEYRLGKMVEVENEEDTTEFKPFLGIIYSFEYQNNRKYFFDEEDTTNTFFPNDYYGDEYIKDSVRYRKISNIIQLKQYENSESKVSFGKRAYIGQELIKATSPGPNKVIIEPKIRRYSNIYAGGGIFRQTGKFWRWNFDGKIYLLGRNIGQTELSGVISKPFTLLGDSTADLRINGSIQNLVADYFQEEYISQHAWWDNDFKMEQRMTVNGSFKSSERQLELGANYAIINNFIYNDTIGIPSQTSNELLVLSAYVDKDFSLRNIHFRTRLLWQKASNQNYLHLPDFSAFVSAYYTFVISKVLFTQIGVDTRYNTAYYADAYDPSTGLFHLQDDVKVGGFPYIDAYASLRLKRTRVFFKMVNIGTEFIDKAYFTVPHYPMNRRTFRLGVSWAFYD